MPGVDVLGIRDPRRGRHVTVLFAGWRNDATPSRIADHDGQQWVVEEVLDHWLHPDYGSSGAAKVPYGIEAERWRLVVDGPLPYEAGRGRRRADLRTFNDGAGWYIVPPGVPAGTAA